MIAPPAYLRPDVTRLVGMSLGFLVEFEEGVTTSTWTLSSRARVASISRDGRVSGLWMTANSLLHKLRVP